MRAFQRMPSGRTAVALALAFGLTLTLLSACGRNKPAGATADSGVTADTGGGGDLLPPPGDGGKVACLDQPNDLPRAPSGRLPCELLPPGLAL